MSDIVPVSVTILDKEYRVGCPEDERDALLKSAQYLDEKMREIRDSGKVIGADRIAVMAALNIVNEMMQQKAHRESYAQNMGDRIRTLQDRIDSALGTGKQLEL